LWPLLDEFTDLPVTAVDILPHRVADLKAVVRGGLSNLSVLHANATSLPFDAAAFELVTMLEVLEHIPDPRAALTEVCRVAARAIVLSVPSKPDSNPEHIHLFGEAALRELFREARVQNVRFEHVLNHRIAVAIKEA
jgi:ubiquinone/menaquinone biosynthesis C-methylase UbiE